jgi:hypothetical protein
MRLVTRVCDPLGELPTKQENEAFYRLLRAQAGVRALWAALTAHEPVGRDLRKAEAELANATSAVPRGAERSFLALCLWNIIALIPLVVFCVKAQPLFAMTWYEDTRHTLGMRYPPLQICAARTAKLIVSSPCSVMLLVLGLLVLWFVQRKLPRWRARMLVNAAFIVEILLVVLFESSLVFVMFGPMF